MSESWDAYGTLTFPTNRDLATFFEARVDDKARAAVSKLARGEVSGESIRKMLATYQSSTTDFVHCHAQGTTLAVSYSFDGSLLLEHGASFFGALARAAAFGASGSIHIEDSAHPAYVLTLDGRSAKLAKWPKKIAAPAEARAAHMARVQSWSKK